MQEAQSSQFNNDHKKLEITVRLFNNPKFSQTYGKGLRHSVIFNGSVEIKNEPYRYLVDLCSHSDWVRTSNRANEDEQTIIAAMHGNTSEDLFSWIQRYDQITKTKQRVTGFCHYDVEAGVMDILIVDEPLSESWKLAVKPCHKSSAGLKSPHLIATNVTIS